MCLVDFGGGVGDHLGGHIQQEDLFGHPEIHGRHVGYHLGTRIIQQEGLFGYPEIHSRE